MTKRRKMKKGVYYIIILIIIIIGGIIFGNKKYKEYKYHQTYEYKLLEHGYKTEEVNKILNNFSEKDYNYFLNNEVNEKYTKTSSIYSFSSFIWFSINPTRSTGGLAINCRIATKARTISTLV